MCSLSGVAGIFSARWVPCDSSGLRGDESSEDICTGDRDLSRRGTVVPSVFHSMSFGNCDFAPEEAPSSGRTLFASLYCVMNMSKGSCESTSDSDSPCQFAFSETISCPLSGVGMRELDLGNWSGTEPRPSDGLVGQAEGAEDDDRERLSTLLVSSGILASSEESSGVSRLDGPSS